MTRKFTGRWIDVSCMSRNFYRCKLNHLLFLMVNSVQDSKTARKTAQKRCVQTGGSPYWKVVWSNRKMRWKDMDVYFTVSKAQGLVQQGLSCRRFFLQGVDSVQKLDSRGLGFSIGLDLQNLKMVRTRKTFLTYVPNHRKSCKTIRQLKLF